MDISAIPKLIDLWRSGELEASLTPIMALLDLLANYKPAADLSGLDSLERLHKQHEDISAALFGTVEAISALPLGDHPEGFEPEEITDGLSAYLSDLSAVILLRTPSPFETAIPETEVPPCACPAKSSAGIATPTDDPSAPGRPVPPGTARPLGEVSSKREPDPRCRASQATRDVYGDGCLRHFSSCEGCPMLGPAEGVEHG